MVARDRNRDWRRSVAGAGAVCLEPIVTVPKDATEVEVVGQQWQWSFRLPGKDGKLGTPNHATSPRQSLRP